MNPQLLGGWRDITDDVRLLASGLRSLPDICTCGQASGHLAGTCSCCNHGERVLGNGCTDCETLLATVRDRVDELVDATLRFLPLVETMTAAGKERADVAQVRDIRRQVVHVEAVFQRLETAADEFRSGCPASHVGPLWTVAAELAAATQELDALLRPIHVPVDRFLPRG